MTYHRLLLMNILEEYKKQQEWRRWDDLIAVLPIRPSDPVLDLGCSIGEVSQKLAARCKQVIGLDISEEFLSVARARQIPNATFRQVDLNTASPVYEAPLQGIWMSFVAAYFPDFQSALLRWTQQLTMLGEAGWIAILEINDLYSGHSPLSPAVKTKFQQYETHSFRQGWYDFQSGSRLKGMFRELGLELIYEAQPYDPELHFNGPIDPHILPGWQARLTRMKSMEEYFGKAVFSTLKDAFLRCLQHEHHQANNTLYFYILKKKPDTSS